MPDLKLLALDSEDLDVISATTQDAAAVRLVAMTVSPDQVFGTERRCVALHP